MVPSHIGMRNAVWPIIAGYMARNEKRQKRSDVGSEPIHAYKIHHGHQASYLCMLRRMAGRRVSITDVALQLPRGTEIVLMPVIWM